MLAPVPDHGPQRKYPPAGAGVRHRPRLEIRGTEAAVASGGIEDYSSAMLDACRRGDIAAVRDVLAHGADPNGALDDAGEEEAAWRTTRPLHAAIAITRRHGRGPHRVETARLLLEAGADPRMRGTSLGVTPVVLAALAG